jgi:hypothetical protein
MSVGATIHFEQWHHLYSFLTLYMFDTIHLGGGDIQPQGRYLHRTTQTD